MHRSPGWLLCGVLACSAGGKAAPPTPPTNSVLERNNHPSRDGHFVQPTLTRSVAATMRLDLNWTAYYPGISWGSPLYLENGPNGGLFFIATTNNDVFAFDEATAQVVWMTNIGHAPAANGVACGNIHPLGIVGTPVIDAAARTLYVAGAVGQDVIERHEVHALSVDDGRERPGWPIDVATVASGSTVFMAPDQNQRGALSLAHGILYVPYGGHIGDCGDYHGWIVAIDTKDPSRVGAWATAGEGEGIWAAGGLASDGDSLFATTGNNVKGTVDHLDSEEVVRITGLGQVERKDANLFYPTHWQTMDMADADFASSNPMVFDVPGAHPSALLFAAAKDGHVYLLDRKNLGGMGGAVADLQVGTGNIIRTVPAAYTSESGVHVTLAVDDSTMCPNGLKGLMIMSILIPPGTPPKPQVAWCVPRLGYGAPIATTTDGKSDAIVWFISLNTLIGVDGETGQILFDGGGESCGPFRPWTSPIPVKGRMVVPSDGAYCAWSPQPPTDASTAD